MLEFFDGRDFDYMFKGYLGKLFYRCNSYFDLI